MASKNTVSAATQTKRLVFCAILCALGFVLSLLGTLLGIFDLTAIIFAGLFVALVMMELNARWAVLVWLVTSALMILFSPNKEIALEYFVFAGFYPIIKNLLERLPSRVPEWIMKLLYFNLMLTALILAVTKIGFFMTPDNDLKLHWLVYLLGNLFFLLYDVCLTVYIRFYVRSLRSRLKLYKFLQ